MKFQTGLFYQRPLATLVAIAVFACGVVSISLRAQGTTDPNVIWFRAYSLVRTSQKLEEDGKYLEALQKINDAQRFYIQLEHSYPEFLPDIIGPRRKLNEEKRDELRYLMRNPPAPGQPRAQPVHPKPNSGARERNVDIAKPEGEFALPSWNEGEGNSQALPQIGRGDVKSVGAITGEITRDLEEKLRRKDSLIAQLAGENRGLEEKIRAGEAEMGRQRSLSDSLRSENAILKKQVAKSSGANRQRLIELLGEAIDRLEVSDNLNKALLADNEVLTSKIKKLSSRVVELQKERNNLLEIVSGDDNGGKALKELMDRNSQLTKQLNRAENLASSLSELNTKKDSDIALLKSEIAKVKMERDNLFADNNRHQKNIKRLEMLADGLSAEERRALASVNPIQRQENELLRSLVLKQLRRQAQIKQAKELLLRQLDKVGARSESLLGIVADIASGPQFTAEEKALFKSPQFSELMDAASSVASGVNNAENSDGEGDDKASVSATLSAPGSDPKAGGVIKEQKLSVELEQLDKSARMDFEDKNYAEAEAGFLRYLHFQPQSVSCLCNLGILKMAMKNFSEAENYFAKALAMDNSSGLGHYLLGRTYFLQKKFDEALVELQQGIKLDPRNAKAHNCLGVISSQKGLVNRAEEAFTRAVSIDPDYGDAHFNLAVLYFTRDQPDAKKTERHYLKALELKIPRSAEIESYLKQAEAAGVILGMR